MKKAMLTAAAASVAMLAFQGVAHAAIVDFTYLGTSGSGISINGTLTTGMTNPSGSFFTPSVAITGISGFYNGSAITGLLPAGTFYVTGGIFGSPGNDNILYYPSSQTFNGQPIYLDRYGLSFSTATQDVNLFFGAGGYGEINRPIGGTAVSSNIGGTFNVSVAAVPEPATWAMLLLGFGAIGAMLRGKRRQALPASV